MDEIHKLEAEMKSLNIRMAECRKEHHLARMAERKMTAKLKLKTEAKEEPKAEANAEIKPVRAKRTPLSKAKPSV